MSSSDSNVDLLSLAAGIVSAHVSHNDVPTDGVPDLIRSVYAALTMAVADPVLEVRPEPAVQAKKSVFPDYIVCLEDGRKLKMLKRHLQTSYGLTPEAYRTRWDLPRDYPMVAPNFASHRSSVAKSIGLGRRERVAAENVPVQQVSASSKDKKAGASA